MTDAMREFPAFAGDGYTLFYAEDPDPENLGCEGFPQTRLWIQRDDGTAELVSELPEAGTIYPGPNGRILIVTGCEGFLGSLYHADVSVDGRFSNIAQTYLALEAAYGFEWVDRDTITLTAATYEGAWGGKEDETRPLTIDLENTKHVVITTRGEAPAVATVTECSLGNGTLTVVAEDDLFGQVRIDGDRVTYLDRTVTATASDTNEPDPDFPLWNMFGTTATGEGVVVSVWGPDCF
ncbi:MAG: hypothetical protein KJO36_00350 [Acidimicrobiia bacterium]|nr:hypothetical protein [Acidimicrobiia bacterium]